MNTKSYVNIHHTAILSKDNSEQFEVVNEAHRVRWTGATKSSLGFYGGYHYLIERNGYKAQFRNDDEVGAHNNVSLMNYRAIGVCFAGNMSEQFLTKEQIISGVELIKELQEKYGIPDENVTPHRKYKSTQCPGNNLPDPVWGYLKRKYEEVKTPDWRDEIEEWAAQYLKDPKGFFESPDPHKIATLIKRVHDNKKL